MSIYHSGFSDSVEAFVNSRKISGAWNETVFGLNIRIFDHCCARHYPTETLRQEMVDIWCAKRETENVNSCYTRHWSSAFLSSTSTDTARRTSFRRQY